MLAEILHKVAQMEAGEQKEYAYRPRPSLAGPDRCIRQLVYQASGVELDKAKPGRMYHIFNDGHWHEELTDEWIAKTAYRLHSKQMPIKVEDMEPRLFGSIDGIITDPLGKDYLWEHKGLSHFACIRYEKGKEFPEDYFTQCAIYLRGLYADNPFLTEGILLIKNKNTSAFLEYHMTYFFNSDLLVIDRLTCSDGTVLDLHETREAIVGNACHKFRMVADHAANGTLPERPYGSDDWHCEYCSYSQRCWAGYVEELKSNVGFAELEEEVADTCRYYRELGAHIAEQEKEKDELQAKLFALMKERHLAKAKAGEYSMSVTAFNKEKIDWDQVPPSLQAEIDRCKIKTPVSFVRVTALKKKEA